jgi:hypothetical protein
VPFTVGCPKPPPPVVDCSKLPVVTDVNPFAAVFMPGNQYVLNAGTYIVSPGGLPTLKDDMEKLCIRVRLH